jgi:hypothetical protein
MVITTPSIAATIPNPGRESAIVAEGGGGLRRVVVMHLQIEIQHLVKVEASTPVIAVRSESHTKSQT